MAATAAVSGCEGHGDTKGTDMASGLGMGPSTEAASQENTWRELLSAKLDIMSLKFQGNREAKKPTFSPKCPPGDLSAEGLFQKQVLY